MPVNGKPIGRFQLPALTPVTFSLTEGTDIPPPPESPIEKTAPSQTEPITPDSSASTKGHNGLSTANGASSDARGRSSAMDVAPLSPASSTQKPNSIRRFLSRRALNDNYTNGMSLDGGSEENLNAAGIARPESSLSFLDRPGFIKKKSGGWFKRLGGGGNENGGGKRGSVFSDSKSAGSHKLAVKKGPPPPKIPELNEFKFKVSDDQGSLGGGDMFKNIK